MPELFLEMQRTVWSIRGSSVQWRVWGNCYPL